jgi:hypothetical protein
VSTDRIAQEQRLLDPETFQREYMAEFVDAASAWLPWKVFETATDAGVTTDRPWFAEYTYSMAIDASGGGACGFALAVGHVEMRDGRKVFVHDAQRQYMKPAGGDLDMLGILREMLALARAYRITRIFSDNYAGVWPKQWFADVAGPGAGITIVDPILVKQGGQEVYLHKAEAFREIAPYLQAGTLRLLAVDSMLTEFRNLESRPLQGGRIYIGRPKARGYLDDQATALATAAAMALAAPRSVFLPAETFVLRDYSGRDRAQIQTRRGWVSAHDMHLIHPHERD